MGSGGECGEGREWRIESRDWRLESRELRVVSGPNRLRSTHEGRSLGNDDRAAYRSLSQSVAGSDLSDARKATIKHLAEKSFPNY